VGLDQREETRIAKKREQQDRDRTSAAVQKPEVSNQKELRAEISRYQ